MFPRKRRNARSHIGRHLLCVYGRIKLAKKKNNIINDNRKRRWNCDECHDWKNKTHVNRARQPIYIIHIIIMYCSCDSTTRKLIILLYYIVVHTIYTHMYDPRTNRGKPAVYENRPPGLELQLTVWWSWTRLANNILSVASDNCKMEI